MTRTDDLAKLDRGERRQLLRFVTSFAWADLQITPGEVAFIQRLIGRLHLSAQDAIEAASWLETPPIADDIDPARIPKRHRQLFLDAVREMVEVDGVASAEEKESLALLARLTR